MAFKAKMDEFLNDVKSSIPAFTLSPSKPVRRHPGNETKKDEKMKTKLLEAWNNLRYDLGSGGPPLKKDIPIWILGICYHARASLPDIHDDDEEEVPDFENAPAHAKAVFMDFASRPWFTYRKQFPTIKGTNITSDTGWGCMLRSVQMMIAQGLLHHFLDRNWRWLQRQDSHERHLHRMILGWFVDDPSELCPLSIHHLAEIGRKFGNTPGNWYGPSTVAYIVQEAVESGKDATPELRQVSVYVAQDCTVYSGDVYKLCGWKKYSDGTASNGHTSGAKPCHVVTDADYQNSLSTSSASSENWDEGGSETSEMSAFVIPAIPPEDLVPAKKVAGNSIPMTELFYPINTDVEVMLNMPKSNSANSSSLQNRSLDRKTISVPGRGEENVATKLKHGLEFTEPLQTKEDQNELRVSDFSQGSLAIYDPLNKSDTAKNDLERTSNLQSDENNQQLKPPKFSSSATNNHGLNYSQTTYDLSHESSCTSSRNANAHRTKPEVVNVVVAGDANKRVIQSSKTVTVHGSPVSSSPSEAVSQNVLGNESAQLNCNVFYSGLQRKFDQGANTEQPNSAGEQCDSPFHKVDPDVFYSPNIDMAGLMDHHPQVSETSALILIPVRLGESTLNPIYIPCLRAVLTMRSSIGIIGGKPKHSLYFVGFQDEYLLHLDPHYCQTADTPTGYKKNLHNYHTMSIRKTNIKKVDPSCCFGFYCRTQADFEQFKQEAQKYFSPPEKGVAYPMCLVMDGFSDDHQIRGPPPPENKQFGEKDVVTENAERIKTGAVPHETCGVQDSPSTIDDKHHKDGSVSQLKHDAGAEPPSGAKFRKKGNAKTTDDMGSKLNRLFPDKSRFYPKFMRQKSSSPTSRRKNRHSQSSLEHEFELL